MSLCALIVTPTGKHPERRPPDIAVNRATEQRERGPRVVEIAAGEVTGDESCVRMGKPFQAGLSGGDRIEDVLDGGPGAAVFTGELREEANPLARVDASLGGGPVGRKDRAAAQAGHHEQTQESPQGHPARVSQQS